MPKVMRYCQIHKLTEHEFDAKRKAGERYICVKCRDEALTPGKPFKKVLNEALKDPEVKAEYDALAPEFEAKRNELKKKWQIGGTACEEK